MNDLVNVYFEWMYDLVTEENPRKRKCYRRLLLALHTIDFDYSMPMDSNRYDDGINLRYRFGFEKDIDDANIAASLDHMPCTVLEMMVALSIRCEEHIMDDPDIGNRTGKWFWDMIDSLGLAEMTDDRFDFDYVEEVIERFLMRDYERSGKGGLFYIPENKVDMRKEEIWYQLMRYLNWIIEKGNKK